MALAGPGANFIQALVWAVIWVLLKLIGIEEPFFSQMAQAGVMWNIGLLVFNLFPIPPLDGGRILAGLLPARQSIALGRIEPWGFFIVMGLAFTGIIGGLWMEPLSHFFLWLINALVSPLLMLF